MPENYNTKEVPPLARRKALEAESVHRKEAYKESCAKPGASCTSAADTAFSLGRAGL